jgi:hypothetical protein
MDHSAWASGVSVLMYVLWHTAFEVVNLLKVVSVGALGIMSILMTVARMLVVVVFKPATLSPKAKQVGPAPLKRFK